MNLLDLLRGLFHLDISVLSVQTKQFVKENLVRFGVTIGNVINGLKEGT